MDAGMQAPPPGAQAPQEEGGDAAQLVMDVSKSIGGIAKALESVDPKAAEAMAALNQQFQSIINSVGQGGAPAAKGPSGMGMVAPEAGGAKGAIPVGR